MLSTAHRQKDPWWEQGVSTAHRQKDPWWEQVWSTAHRQKDLWWDQGVEYSLYTERSTVGAMCGVQLIDRKIYG